MLLKRNLASLLLPPLILGVLVIPLCLVVVLLAWGKTFGPAVVRWNAMRELSNASTEADLKEIAKPYGIYFTYPDGSWVAISYRDSHSGDVWAMGVAHDSGGNWYESREHFCGNLKFLRKFIDEDFRNAPFGDRYLNEDPVLCWGVRLSDARDLETARRCLEERYFTPRGRLLLGEGIVGLSGWLLAIGPLLAWLGVWLRLPLPAAASASVPAPRGTRFGRSLIILGMLLICLGILPGLLFV